MKTPAGRVPRRGFSMIEMCIAGFLSVFLGMLVLTAWSAFGTPAIDIAARCRLAREASITSATLAADLGGGLMNSGGPIGTKDSGRLVGWLAPGASALWLCFDGGETPDGLPSWEEPDAVISYSIHDGSLHRWDQASGMSNVVANLVDAMTVETMEDRVTIAIQYRYRDFVRVHTFEAIKP